ncbi:MAG: hypothetical protein HQL69_20495 [Magnetococcales bacterium]|nr:hypothetical protein [Magnetococcales bacterium]
MNEITHIFKAGSMIIGGLFTMLFIALGVLVFSEVVVIPAVTWLKAVL